jgi:THO complex subunit 5
MTYSQRAITDPSLKECLLLSDDTRMLCSKILDKIAEGAEADESPSGKAERSRDLKRLLALMAQLKTVHRMNVMNARDSKQDSVVARQEVDRLHLQLQNLYYEQRHLRGEIAACRDFPSVTSSLGC